MQNKWNLRFIILAAVCALIVYISVVIFNNFKKAETEFNKMKAIIVNENLYFKGGMNPLQEAINHKMQALESLQTENDKLAGDYAKELEFLKRKADTLKKRMLALERSPLTDRIKRIMKKEDNENVKKLLQNTIDEIELLKAGRSVELEPKVVTKIETAGPSSTRTTGAGIAVGARAVTEMEGSIVFVDRNARLIVINLGTRNDIRKDDRCVILKNSYEMASGSIVSVRNELSAAFIDDFKRKYTIDDVRESYRVVVKKE